MSVEKMITAVSQHLLSAQRILFITGAGLSADSGLPTYRGIGGLYNENLTKDDIPIEVALSGEMMRRCPEIPWKYLLEIERSCRHAEFNKGHEAIAKIEQEKPDTWVLTQNVDGFHRAAGSHHLIEIHGRFSELYCVQCSYTETVENYSHLKIPPQCPRCNHLIRPNVVLFGESLPSAAVETLYRELAQGFDLVFSVGTSSAFPYITQPVLIAKQQGVPTVEINPGQTHLSHLVDYKFTAGAADSLTQLWEHIWGGKKYLH